MAKVLSKSTFLASFKPRLKKVDLSDIDFDVFVREWTLEEADLISAISKDAAADNSDEAAKLDDDSVQRKWRMTVIASSLCDGDGNLLLSVDDEASLRALPASVVGTVLTAALRHNGLATASNEEAEGN